jgi:hypothetical protein
MSRCRYLPCAPVALRLRSTLPVSDICSFVAGCFCRSAVDASLVCPWEKGYALTCYACGLSSLFQSFGVSQCPDLMCDLLVHTLQVRTPVVFVVVVSWWCLARGIRGGCLVYAICELNIALPWPNKRLLLPLSQVLQVSPSSWRILRSGTGAAGCRLYHSGHTAVRTKQTGALSMQAALVTLSPISPMPTSRSSVQRLCSRCPCTYIHPSSASPVVWRTGMSCTVLLYMHLSAKPESCASVQINYSFQS